MLTSRSEAAFEAHTNGVIAAVFPISFSRLNAAMPFESDVTSRKIGALNLTEVFVTSGTIGRRSSSHLEPRAPQFFVLNLRRSGSVLHTHLGKTFESTSETLSIFDSRHPFESRHLEPTRSLSIRVPGALLRSAIAMPEEYCGVPISLKHGVSAVFREFVYSMWLERDRISDPEGKDLSLQTVNMLKAVCNAAPRRALRSVPSSSEILLGTAMQFIEEHLSDQSLTVERVAQSLQISRGRLYMAARGAENPLGRMILLMRLERCRQALVNPRLEGRRITDIAFDWGFNDTAHFSRTFKSRYGMSPIKYRSEHLFS